MHAIKVTERKFKSFQSEPEYLAAVRNADTAFVFCCNEEIVSANASFYKLTGDTEGHLEGVSVRAVLHPLSSQPMRFNVPENAAEHEQYNVIIRNGETVIVKCSCSEFKASSGIIQSIAVTPVSAPALFGKDSGKVYETLFIENPFPSWIIKNDSMRFLEVNDEAVSHYGYSKEEFASMTLYDILNEEESERLKRHAQVEASQDNIYRGQWQHRTKNASLIDVQVYSRSIVLNGLECTWIVVKDITEKLKAEEEKEFEKRDKEALINNTNNLVWSIGPGFELMAANQNFIEYIKEMTGDTVQRGDILSENVFMNSLIESWQKDFERVLQGEKVKELKYIPPYNNFPEDWIEITGNPIIKQKKIIGVACFARSMTESIYAERKLRESEANLIKAQELAKLGNWSQDLRTGTVTWSEQLNNIFGFTNEDLTKSYEQSFSLIDEKQRDDVFNKIEQTAATGDPFTAIYQITTPSGECKTLEEMGYGVKDSLGRIVKIFGTVQDITESMKIQEELRLSNERYDLVSKATSDAIWDWNICSGYLTRSGNGFKSMFGYDNDFGNCSDFIYDMLIHPDDKEQVIKSQQLAFKDADSSLWECEYRFLKSDGSYAYVYDRGYIIRDEAGNAIRMIGASQDITQRKEYEYEIKRIQQNVNSLIDTAPDPIWSVDTNYKLIAFNETYNRLSAYYFGHDSKEGDLVLWENKDEAVRRFWKQKYDKAFRGEKFSIELKAQHPLTAKGTYYLISFSPIINIEKKVTGVACFSKDITELKESHKNLKDSQSRFSNLFHLSPQPMWLYERETFRFVEVNRSAVETYGYSEEEFLKMTILDIRLKEDVKETLRIIADRRSQKSGNFNTIISHRKKNGEVIKVHVYSTAIIMDGKNYSLVIVIDITDKFRSEINMSKAIIKAQENERYEIGSELHDNICQLLASSKMRIGMLKECLPEEKMHIYDQSRQYIISALDEIRNLSHRLAPSFFNEKTLEEAFNKLFDSFSLSEKYVVITHFDPSIKEQPINLELKLNLYRILQEQLRNIIKYAKANLVEIDVLIHKNQLKMRISDNGVGFVVKSVKSGIGLSNMKRRTELFDGKFNITTSPGNGTEIMVEIPLQQLYN